MNNSIQLHGAKSFEWRKGLLCPQQFAGNCGACKPVHFMFRENSAAINIYAAYPVNEIHEIHGVYAISDTYMADRIRYDT